jgi:prepilin-type N-terminal cleavage/methylation domain-containing protein/prepilin-type processing-associated H-X9-DG protein
MKQTERNRGFTLVELLVVITIIAILIALLLPAVQTAREAARRLQCGNHIKQLALGCIGHENLTGRYPTGGWGYAWTGDADCGTDWRQRGGWLYNVLPFIEQQPLHDLGIGTGDWDNSTADSAKKKANGVRQATPLDAFYCPSRRSTKPYPFTTTSGGGCVNIAPSPPTVVGRSDYAANGGSVYVDPTTGKAWDYGGPGSVTAVESSPGVMTATAQASFAKIARAATGIAFCGSLITQADVTDGTSNTYLLGEKYCNPDNYETGIDQGDNEAAMNGDNEDVTRFTALAPVQDQPGNDSRGTFGSAHPSGFNMAFCDGSVQQMSYDINPTVHFSLGHRMDGAPTDSKGYQ